MNHISHEIIGNLSNTIKSSLQKKQNHYRDKKVSDADIIWKASIFFSKILHKASTCYSFNTEEFKKFKTSFEAGHNVKINDKVLFEKYWLRNVFGTIKIAAAIESFCHTFDEIIGYKEELKFLIEFQEKHKPDRFELKKKFEKQYLLNQMSEYEKLHNISLNQKGILFNRWSSEKEGKIEFSDMESYFKPYQDNWDDFIFINALKKYLRSKNKISIKISDFNKLHSFHKKIFPDTPSAEDFITQRLFLKIGNEYKIEFYNSEPRYWSQLENKISGYLWQLLIGDNSFKDDYERLENWVFKITYWEAWPKPFKYIPSELKKKLLDVAFSVIINEKDLEGFKDEFKKIKLEGENRRQIYVLSERALIFDKEFTLKNDNLFEVLESLNSWEENAQTSYLYDQSSRTGIGFLIFLIVLQDEEFYKIELDEDNFEIQNYKRIKELLRTGIDKPYLVWKVSNCIKNYRPDVIPYLLLEEDICSLSFILIDKLEYNSEHKNYFKSKVWKETVIAVLKNCIKSNYTEKQIAKIVFDLYKILNKDKYNFNYQNNHDDGINYESELLNLIENFKIDVRYHSKFKNDYLLPQISNELSILFVNLESKTIYRNGLIRFPMLQWDGIFWLLKISTYWKYKQLLASLNSQFDDLVNKFYDSYIKTIETAEVTKYNFFDSKEETGIPLWSEKIEKVGLLDWLYPIYYIHENGDLNSFLNPRLKIVKGKKQNEHNRFIVDKLRTHIGVLLQLLKRIIETPIPYSFEEVKILEIKAKIENQIIDYIKNYSKEDIQKGFVDLFSYNQEWQFQKSEKEALLPQLAMAINWFTDKEKVIDVIVNHGDLSKILVLLENATSEGTKRILLGKIKGIEIRGFLEEFRWIPEIQNVLLKMSSYPELIEQTEEAIKYWEDEILQKRNEKEYKILLFKTKLLLAYFRNDLSEINSIQPPEKENFYNSHELNYSEYTRFYTALFYIQTDPKKSYQIFNDLVTKNPNYNSFALNRLVAKVNWAEKDGNLEFYREAFEEWKEYKKIDDDSSLSLEDASESISILDKLDKNDEIEKVYQNLELPIKMNPNILRIKIKNLIKQRKIDEALILKEKAKKYHQYASELDLDLISELENLISGVDNIDELKNFYHKIFSSEPSKLIRIFPENINGKEVLNEFIVNEVVIASDKMLEKIKSISEIGHEDKYNDILEVILDARINSWGWHVGAQSRGAFSAPKDGSNGFQPGERDLPIMNRNKQAIQICEAFIYRGTTTAKEHIKKLFDYHHKKEAMTIIVYDTGQVDKKTFNKNWDDYINKIVPKVKYPTGYEFDKINDVTSDYKMKLSAIKIANSLHKSGTVLHHIFININYKIT